MARGNGGQTRAPLRVDPPLGTTFVLVPKPAGIARKPPESALGDPTPARVANGLTMRVSARPIAGRALTLDQVV